jgi:hypothetical protein
MPNNDYQKEFQVVCPNSKDLDGKKVRFWFEIDQKVRAFSGTFRVHRILHSEKVLLDIDTSEFDSKSPPDSYWLIHLAQAHVDSISAVQTDGIDYEVTLPCLCRHRKS